MMTRIFRSDDNLEVVEIFLRFTLETFLTAGIFAIFEVVTMTLESLASFEQDGLHRRILDIVEYSISVSSALVILLVIVYLTAVTALGLYFNFIRNWREKNQVAPVEAAVQALPVDEDPPVEESSAGIKFGSLRINNRFFPIALFVAVLGILGIFMVQQAQINSNKRKAEVSEQELRSDAIRNFVTLCREGKGTFDVRSLICQYQDGRAVPVRLVRAVTPKKGLN